MEVWSEGIELKQSLTSIQLVRGGNFDKDKTVYHQQKLGITSL